MAMKSNEEQLKLRGYIENNELKYYLYFSKARKQCGNYYCY